MPQEHFVLRCFSCETFQAHVVKKTKKWECKICGAKQSVKRNFGKGSGKDCRIQVMKLNELRLRNECSFNEAEPGGTSDEDLAVHDLKVQSNPNKQFTSKWDIYLEEADSESEVDDSVKDFFVNVEEKKKKRMIKSPENYSNKCKKVCLESKVNEEPPSVTSYYLSSSSGLKNFESHNTEERGMKKDSPVQSKSKLKLSKYAVYLGDDDDSNGGDDVKVNKSDIVMANKCLNVFDSELCDLDEILSLE